MDVPGLLSSPDCVGAEGEGGMTPLYKWLFSMFLPFGILSVFAIWHRFLPRDSTSAIVKTDLSAFKMDVSELMAE